MDKRSIESKVSKAMRVMRKSVQQEKKCLNLEREATKALEDLIAELRVLPTKRLTEKD